MLVSSPARLHALRDIARRAPVRLVVRGDCMAPRLEDGTEILVSRRALYWPGDVVAFRSAEGRLLVHRVLGILPTLRGGVLLAQGDARSRPDNLVPLRSVVGALVEGGCRPPVPWAERRRAFGRCLRQLVRLLLGRWPSASGS